MLTDDQLDTLTGIADAVSKVEIRHHTGHATMNDSATEAVMSLYKLGIIQFVDDDLTVLTKQFTICCNLVNDAFNGYSISVDYERLAKLIGLNT